MRKSIFVILTLSLLGSLFMVACHRSPENRADWIEKKLTTKLKLTPEQVQKLDVIKKEYLAKRASFDQKEREKRFSSLKEAFLNEKLESATLEKLIAEPASVVEMKAFGVTKAVEFHDLLTPEQRKIFIAEINRMEKCHHFLPHPMPF